ncbi:hypothetical protein [Alkalihalobacillus sp. CinArs1]|uniref:hypothetical protein n=1 Tax=Alkalihalobacillus sp. CinArs1 TaxID=2995314 RepID=UPI0022DD8943|nr:hypothetical protein [Alkalihalobacillus sp. CinArs1]
METTEMVSRIQETLNDWVGGHLIIQKQENEDLDKVIMVLDRISLFHREETIDNYTPSSLLQLEGKGKIISEKNPVSLPDANYEVQLEDLKEIDRSANELKITTERAHYVITYNSN